MNRRFELSLVSFLATSVPAMGQHAGGARQGEAARSEESSPPNPWRADQHRIPSPSITRDTHTNHRPEESENAKTNLTSADGGSSSSITNISSASDRPTVTSLARSLTESSSILKLQPPILLSLLPGFGTPGMVSLATRPTPWTVFALQRAYERLPAGTQLRSREEGTRRRALWCSNGLQDS
jgi:hypothetical protein